MDKDKIEYKQLETGFEFAPVGFKLDATMVSDYIRAVEETSPLYQATGLVPPLAVAALAMAGLMPTIALPPGTIHVSQELELKDTVGTTDDLTSYTRVGKKQDRGKLHLLTIAFNVLNQRQQTVLSGRAVLMLPEG